MHPWKPDLPEIWRRLASGYSPDESLVDALYSDLDNHYSEPHRYYHNWSHIEALLNLFFQYKGEIQKGDVVLFAIFYHDVVYVPGKGDNEYQSAVLAKRALEQLGVPPGMIEEVQHFIEATSQHKLYEDADPDLKFFIDFDLSILAADREVYQVYLINVRREYGYLSTEQFAGGRGVFLRSILSQEHIFYTESFRAKEERARKNMQWEIQMSPGIYSAL